MIKSTLHAGFYNLRSKVIYLTHLFKCLCIKQKYILRNNLESKHSPLMKFNQFMSYYERKIFVKFSTKAGTCNIAPDPLVCAKN